MITELERIAAAIAEAYPEESCVPELAEQLFAAAEVDGVAVLAVLAWLHDRPPHELSTAAFRAWCRRYAIVGTREPSS